MRLLIFAISIFSSFSALAGQAESFSCRLNLRRGMQTQAFRLDQRLAVDHSLTSLKEGGETILMMTQGTIPFDVHMNWERFTAKITIRRALELNTSGQPVRAAQWKCFESSIETAEGLETFSCGDKDRKVDPFSDPNQRWQLIPIKNNSPQWPRGPVFQEGFETRDVSLTLDCGTADEK